MQPSSLRDVRVVGRYALHSKIASGGMASVHFGRLLGQAGFSRTVAVKRLHPQFAADPDFVAMFMDEAKLAVRIRHPNVIQTLDIVQIENELFLVMEYVEGETLANLAKFAAAKREPIPHRIISSVVAGALHGLHAAHEAKDERGMPLGIVHRDVSPQNIHIGTDGIARVIDFGVAKAAGRSSQTQQGQLKGKLSYMSPEQLRGSSVSRTSDIYAVGVMLWELITGQRLFDGDNEGVVLARVLEGKVEPPSAVMMRNSPVTMNSRMYETLNRLDGCVLRALARDPSHRYQTAREMALDLESSVNPATLSQVTDWVEETAEEVLAKRKAIVAEIESHVTEGDYSAPSLSGFTPSHGVGIGVGGPGAPYPGPVSHPIGSLTPSDIHNSTLSGATTRPSSSRPLMLALIALAAVSALAVALVLMLTREEETFRAGEPQLAKRPLPAPSSTPDLPPLDAGAEEPQEVDAGKPPVKQPPPAPRTKKCELVPYLTPDGMTKYKEVCR